MKKYHWIIGFAGLGIGAVGLKTFLDLQPVEQLYWKVVRARQNTRITDRQGHTLLINYTSPWNYHEQLRLDQFPYFLIKALLTSEDNNFYCHKGIDWRAKGAAVWQNLKARRILRGASTVTEQVVHLLTQRPRTFWSKWLELIEACLIEKHLSKNHLLEFYLNQVPFAANRHGFVQGSHHYFNRDLSTLTPKEMLALILLIKAPSSYDLYKTTKHIEQKLLPFLKKLYQQKLINEDQIDFIKKQDLTLEKSRKPIDAYHFITYLKKYFFSSSIDQSPTLRTTLDRGLQEYSQKMLDQRLDFLKSRQVHNGAILVVDHATGEVLSWVVGGQRHPYNTTPSSMIDAVTTLRQPGSTLKPFVYAMALQKGWKTTTLIEDAPLTGPINNGMHKFRNYSNIHYGLITLREALANSLNIPAIKTIQFVGTANFLELLRKLGFTTLNRGADIYEEGLALGNGEVSLLELVHAYATLANKGIRQELKFFFTPRSKGEQILPSTITSTISDILSDPWARRLEFGLSPSMSLSLQTAIKTGTSTDYRDAWIVGYNHKYVVGIWMGNLDNSPMDGITGSIGPALVLKSIFSFLEPHQDSQGLYLSPALIHQDVLIRSEKEKGSSWQTELFTNDEEDELTSGQEIKILKPPPGLRMAIDPRIPPSLQKFEFKLTALGKGEQVEWIVNDKKIAITRDKTYLWTLTKGKHSLKVNVYKGKECIYQIPEIKFLVK